MVYQPKFAGKPRMMHWIHFNFICIVPNHNIHYLKALYRVRPRPYFVIEKNPTVPTKTKALGNNRGKEKLSFNRKKPPTELGSGWVAVCLDRLGLRGERGSGGRREEKRQRE